MSEILNLENISLRYHTIKGETLAVSNLDLKVDNDEFISIVGPSGCGKSSLLSVITGLIKPSTGSVKVGGEIGYMLQKDHLLEWRNIYQNAILGLEIQNKLTEDNKDYVKNLLERYGLGEFKNHYPSQLSGGMRQRVALIRTLAIKPDLLLLDEPFSALDYQTRLSVSDEIGKIIKQEKKTAILVTHDISEAISLADRVIVLSNRPATVKNIHEIKLSNSNGSALLAREAPEFRDYFNKIWKELEVNKEPSK